jgi:ribosomal protein L37AE/L43A
VGFGLVLNTPGGLAVWVLGGVGGLGLLWILGTTFWPARADRTCPECGEEGLRRMDPATTKGLVCASCGHTDAEASGWFLAEEEGALDEVVAKRRRSKP